MSPHILFVDDEAPIRELLSLYFRKKGWRVSTAITPEQATELAGQTPFDAAIVDINLAGSNGLQLLTHFKGKYPKMPVIIFTGLSGEEYLEQAKAAGANGFMRKTESLETLFSEVKQHLPAAGGMPPASRV
jgi:DNA-binding NtrC family response regulator